MQEDLEVERTNNAIKSNENQNRVITMATYLCALYLSVKGGNTEKAD